MELLPDPGGMESLNSYVWHALCYLHCNLPNGSLAWISHQCCKLRGCAQ
jgi:hypothetical protein